MKLANSKPDGPRHAPMKQAIAPASHNASHMADAAVILTFMFPEF